MLQFSHQSCRKRCRCFLRWYSHISLSLNPHHNHLYDVQIYAIEERYFNDERFDRTNWCNVGTAEWMTE